MSDYTNKFHSRKSIRLKGYDYSRKGLYFITICCQDRVCRFGHVENGIMILNEFGQIANDEWMKLQHRFENFELDAFQIMPNHMHGIIKLNEMPQGQGSPLTKVTVITKLIDPNQLNPNQQPITHQFLILLVHTNHWYQIIV